MPNAHATILRTNSGSSCRWLRMILSLGTRLFRDVLRRCTMQLLAREHNAVRQLIDRSTLHWRSLARVLQNEQLWNGCLWRKAAIEFYIGCTQKWCMGLL